MSRNESARSLSVAQRVAPHRHAEAAHIREVEMLNAEGASSEAGSTWEVFTTDAPELARRVRARFTSNLHHVIGTLRPNGAPRLSGTEVDIGPDGVRIGMMAGSRKLADVRRDPRVEVHSAPLEENLAEGDAKLAGRLVEVDSGEPEHAGAGRFELVLELVSLVRVDGDELVFATWQPGRGERQTRRR